MLIKNLSAVNNILPGSRAEIRLMDKIMRQTGNSYPVISPFRVNMRLRDKTTDLRYILWLRNLFDKINEQRALTQELPFINIFFSDTKFIKNCRIGNCGELSSAVMSSLIANGYDDGKIARLVFEAEARDLKTKKIVGRKIIDTTHEFVVRHLAKNADISNPKTYGKNLVIIDAWEGFCGNLQEGFKRYYDSFLSGMRHWINKEDNVEIIYKPKLYFCRNVEICDIDKKIFRQNFPELVVK